MTDAAGDRPGTNASTARARSSGKGGKDAVLTLEYRLDDLPSSQHRAGLAGLVHMCRWLKDQPHRAGVCELVSVTDRTVVVRMDRLGVAALLDEVYGATSEDRPYPRPFKNKDPVRTEDISETHPKTGKVKTSTRYYYPVVIPKGAFLTAWYEDKPAWLKLWRDMLWQIMRGVPAQRAPFEARARGEADKLAADTWKELTATGARQTSVDLPSTYYLGAQATTAENVTIRDRARSRFLLHFWPFVAPIYVPAELDADGKTKFRGYALAVPDVADVDAFCFEIEHTLRGRGAEVAGYVPCDAVVVLPIESALDLLSKMHELVRRRTGGFEDIVHGIDVFHVDKQGNNVRVLSTARMDVDQQMEDAYRTLRDRYRERRFRRQRLLNLIADRPWYAGFDRIAATVSTEHTIESHWFCADVWRAFHREGDMNEDDRDAPDASTETIESLIFRIARTYVSGKLRSKYEQDYKRARESVEAQKDYNKYKEKVARDAFLAIRSRTGDEFVAYFSGTLCSVPQWLTEAHFTLLSRALHDDTEKTRTLTLLALSASAYAPKAKDNAQETDNGQA